MALTPEEQQILVAKLQLLEFPDLMAVVSIVNDGRDPAELDDAAFQFEIAQLPVDKVRAIQAFVNRERESDDEPPPPPPVPAPKKKKMRQTTMTHVLAVSHKRPRPPPGERADHNCPECDKVFKRPYQLQTHRAVAHNTSGAHPFQCPTCDQQLSNAANLKRHMRAHAGERPYVCMHCGKTFSQSGNCKQHEFSCGGSTVRVKRAGEVVKPPPEMLVTELAKRRKRAHSDDGEEKAAEPDALLGQ
jgi:DNA-directed RNA polymerase subunit M/transcription elongation factor TFIIS